MYPNVIIAGTNKAGTTSLFRYLADHPAVCPSAIKEVRHFTREPDPLATAALERYAGQFSSYAGEQVCLEASPDYLSGGAPVAGAIGQLLPDVKLVFILREPISRLISGYRRRQSRQESTLAGVSLQQYLDNVATAPAGSLAAADLDSVSYAALLAAYLQQFDAQQIAVHFFDELSADTPAFVADICSFLGISADFYADYAFRIENQTRNVRFQPLQRLAHKANMAAEPLLNSVPGLRRGLRRVYNRVNEDKRAAPAEQPDLYALRQRLLPEQQRLSEMLLTSYPGLALPAWLPQSDEG